MRTSTTCGTARRALLLGGILLLAAALVLSLFAGTQDVSAGELLRALLHPEAAAPAALVLRYARLPRALGGLLCGAGLSASGLLLQEALSNDLASPGVIGVNAGAGFFVLLGVLAAPGNSLVRIGAAFLGAGAAAGLVLGISKLAGSGRYTILLTGVAVSSLFSAGINTITTFFPETAPDRAAFSLGGLQGITTAQLAAAFPVILAGILAALFLSRGMDLLRLGDEAALGAGLNVSLCRVLAIADAALLAAASVTLCGLVGFVGLIIPNLIRRRVDGAGPQLLFGTLYGSSFLVLCDVAARSWFYPYELPVGLLLSFLGAPFFLLVLIRRKRRAKL